MTFLGKMTIFFSTRPPAHEPMGCCAIITPRMSIMRINWMSCPKGHVVRPSDGVIAGAAPTPGVGKPNVSCESLLR